MQAALTTILEKALNYIVQSSRTVAAIWNMEVLYPLSGERYASQSHLMRDVRIDISQVRVWSVAMYRQSRSVSHNHVASDNGCTVLQETKYLILIPQAWHRSRCMLIQIVRRYLASIFPAWAMLPAARINGRRPGKATKLAQSRGLSLDSCKATIMRAAASCTYVASRTECSLQGQVALVCRYFF
ncbi:hypothetical protein SS50377_25959 [Spironucleus salmonicida]|uniref:Uncharacterized protein n=2 Tax=Spironucleus salmonicida TaxID=348837 RepID=A0A9P8LPE7_9EUKA|nr:hypothetical protein SS50377_25959 [Spironucleus salmonicida]